MAFIERALFVTACMFVAGCFPGRAKTISASDFAEPRRTRIVNQERSEGAPGRVSDNTLVDEAILVSRKDALCVDVTVRTAAGVDMPLSDWDASFNGHPVHFENERVAVRRYPFTRERDVLVAHRWSRRGGASLRLTRTEDESFDVVERRAMSCFSRSAYSDKMALLLKDANGWRWLKFEWKVQ